MTRSLAEEKSGATAIEFAITLPVFLMFVFELIQLGFAFWSQFAIQHGTEAAARCAVYNHSICGSSSAIQTFASQQSYGLAPSPSIFVVSSPSCGQQVAASYQVTNILGYLSISPITVNGMACVPV